MSVLPDSATAARTGAGPRLLALWGVSLTVWWGFAFFPTAPGDDTWIATAQYACFGSRPGEPPAAQGWMMLVLAPLALLAVLLVLHGAELRAELPRLRASRSAGLLALALASLFSIEAGLGATRLLRAARADAVSFESAITEPLPAGFPRTALPVPAFELIDQQGRATAAEWLRGEPTVLSFVFGHCRTVCPVLVSSVTRAVREPGAQGTRIALVTLDPWRDTPTTLPALAAGWALPAGSRALSGQPGQVARLLDALGVARERDLRNGDVSHVPLVMIVDAQGRIAYRFQNPPVEWIAEGIRRVKARP